MKQFAIYTNYGELYTIISAKNSLQALKEYRKGLTSTGYYWIEKQGKEYHLLSTYGMNLHTYEIH